MRELRHNYQITAILDFSKGAFLWNDPDQDQRFKIILIMMHQRNRGIHYRQGFLGSLDAP